MIPAGGTAEVAFTLGEQELEWWNESIQSVAVTPGKYELLVGGARGKRSAQTVSLTISQ